MPGAGTRLSITSHLCTCFVIIGSTATAVDDGGVVMLSLPSKWFFFKKKCKVKHKPCSYARFDVFDTMPAIVVDDGGVVSQSLGSISFIFVWFLCYLVLFFFGLAASYSTIRCIT
jgi:hypothetical protein